MPPIPKTASINLVPSGSQSMFQAAGQEIVPAVKFLALFACAGVIFSSPPASAQVQNNTNQLSLELAMEAAGEAVRVCASQGWPVSVSVVDAAGNLKLQAKGDHSTIHTKDSSFRKAYTVVTMGPVFGFDAHGIFAEKLKNNPNGAALASLPDILALPGAVAVKMKGEIVAAIGVGGAPGGEKDEVCAAAGLTKIKDRLL